MIAAFGEQGVVELGTIIGYYTAIGNALNVFEVALPDGSHSPFPNRAGRGRAVYAARGSPRSSRPAANDGQRPADRAARSPSTIRA